MCVVGCVVSDFPDSTGIFLLFLFDEFIFKISIYINKLDNTNHTNDFQINGGKHSN